MKKRRAQFRGEIFSFFNHPVWGVPGTSVNGPTFGQVSGTLVNTTSRQIQLALKMDFKDNESHEQNVRCHRCGRPLRRLAHGNAAGTQRVSGSSRARWPHFQATLFQRTLCNRAGVAALARWGLLVPFDRHRLPTDPHVHV